MDCDAFLDFEKVGPVPDAIVNIKIYSIITQVQGSWQGKRRCVPPRNSLSATSKRSYLPVSLCSRLN